MQNCQISLNLLYLLHDGLLQGEFELLDAVDEILFFVTLHRAAEQQQQHFLHFGARRLCRIKFFYIFNVLKCGIYWNIEKIE